jgi:hypothetical protein
MLQQNSDIRINYELFKNQFAGMIFRSVDTSKSITNELR